MSKIFYTVTLLFFIFTLFPTLVSAQSRHFNFLTQANSSSSQRPQTCAYSSTQARVKRIGHHPWEQHLNLSCGESFEVGGFHDQTGQYANDVTIQVTGPDFNQSNYRNGDKFTFHVPGQYQVIVTTNSQPSHQYGACWDRATVTVSCPRPTPTPSPTATPKPTSTPGDQQSCEHQSTQVRVKREGFTNSWQEDLVIQSCRRETIELGSFHNGTDQYATDTEIIVWDAGVPNHLLDQFGDFFKQRLTNGDKYIVMPFRTYIVKAKTRNSWGKTNLGEACKDETTVQVRCDWRK